MYLRVFKSAEGITFHPIERFATPDRVFRRHVGDVSHLG
jgi:hypothetical protein